MKTINSPETLALALMAPMEPTLKRLLCLRVEQLTGYEGYNVDDLAVFLIVEPGDSLAAVEAELRISLTVNMIDGIRWPDLAFLPSWEWCERIEGIDPTLLSLFRTFAEGPSCN